MVSTQSPVIPFNSQSANDPNTDNAPILQLPEQGMSRARDLLPFLPFSRTTLHEWSRDGRFPSPVKLSPTMVAWRNSDVLDWLDAQGDKNLAMKV